MAKKKSKFVDYSIYLLVRVFVCFVQMLSWNGARHVAHGLAWLAHRIDKRHRNVARENLQHAFPGKYTEAELDRMVLGVYRHFCTMLTEIILVPRKLCLTNYKNHIKLINSHLMVNALLCERPLLIVTCHFGNWEVAGYFLGLCGFTTHAIARPLDNPYLDDFLRNFRERTGQKILAKHGEFDLIMDVLESGGILATLGDQDAGKRGLFVEFFGRPASTHKAIALMALENQVPILVTGTYKVGEPLKYHIHADEIIMPEDFANDPAALRSITERFTASVERLVRRAPQQYFWVHNRWKSKPAQRKKKQAA